MDRRGEEEAERNLVCELEGRPELGRESRNGGERRGRQGGRGVDDRSGMRGKLTGRNSGKEKGCQRVVRRTGYARMSGRNAQGGQGGGRRRVMGLLRPTGWGGSDRTAGGGEPERWERERERR